MGNNLRNINYILKPSVVISLSAFLVSCGGGGGGGGGSSQPSYTDIYTPSPRYTPSAPQRDEDNKMQQLLPVNLPISKTLFFDGRETINESNSVVQNLQSEQIDRYNNKQKNTKENERKISVIDSGFKDYQYDANVLFLNGYLRHNRKEDLHGAYVLDIIRNQLKNKNNINKPIILIADVGNGNNMLSVSNQVFDEMYKKGARIFNNSWGTSNKQHKPYEIKTLKGLIGDKPEKDSIFVFAAGNDKRDEPTSEASYPKEYDNARNGFIAVAAYDENIKSKLADYSNKFDEKSKKWGIVASGITGNHQGTSFAAPRVTAAVANVWDKFPWMSNHLVTVTILSTADIPGTSTPTEGPNSGKKDVGDPSFGWGILNQERALKGPALLHLDLRTLSKDEQFVQNLFTVDFDYRNYQDKNKLTWSNDIKGRGGIYKKGTGTLYLSGDNQYEGATWIQNGDIVLQNKLQNSDVIIEKQGTLRAESKNGAFAEIGKSITNNGGSLNVYGKGLYIKEKYEGKNGARIVIDIDKSLLKADGNINFGNNGYLLADIENLQEIPSRNTTRTRTIIEANQIENFDSKKAKISNNISNFINIYGLNLNNSQKNLEVKYSRNDTAYVASALGYKANDIAFKTAENLDVVLDELAVSDDKDSQIYQASLSLFAMPAQALSNAINTLSGEIYSSSQNILAKQNETFNKTLSDRISSLIYEDRSGFWANQIFADVNLKNKGYANTSTNIHGSAFGLDKKTDNYILGVSLLSGRAKTDFDKNAGSTNIKNTSVSLYGSYNFDDFYMLGRVGLNSSKSKVEREILDKNSKISYDSKFYNTYTEIGKIFELDKFKINPFFATQLDWLKRDKIFEKDVFGLQADKKTYNLTSLLAGVRTKVEFDKLFISSNLTYINKPSPNDFSFDAKFTGSNSNVKITGIKEAKSTVWFGSNFGYNLTKNIMLNCGFDLSFDSSHNNSKVFNVGGLYRF
ncbi:putative autotransporter serine protease [Campylobacter pinnipediorum subsp. pinnipediorum]|uniref:autotransporter domain-containing protein n=1 Tax=Campylobacter pinnipediorum TaxID=1965231 RepID=UPI000995C7D9|nr:autotransporter domain-containing protein [Campylobacter pinnipediorum]AQW81209.1 putative autotransporter serine protease [Campylobacter pinnipediorum subsp. pinnipediorum]